MSIASTAAKQRWNKAHYAEIKASLRKELVGQFKAKCRENGVSIASALAELMSGYCGSVLHAKRQKRLPTYETRKKRRKAICDILRQLEDILQDESAYRENIPENLQNSIRTEYSDSSIEKLDEALEALREAY